MFKIGQIFIAKDDTFMNKKDDVCIVFDTYNLVGHKGVQVIFENGEYCGYDETEIKRMFIDTEIHINLDYRFHSVMALSADFQQGRFKECFVIAKSLLSKRKLLDVHIIKPEYNSITKTKLNEWNGYIVVVFNDGTEVSCPDLFEGEPISSVISKFELLVRNLKNCDK